MQQYHKLRRDVERQVSRFGALSDPSQFRNSKFLPRALQSHDTFRVAQVLLEAADNDAKEAAELLETTAKLLQTEGPAVGQVGGDEG